MHLNYVASRAYVAVRGRGAGLLAACQLLAATACDPCGATLSCSQPPRLAVIGQILSEETGSPVAGVQIDMVRESGVELFADAISTSTRADGLFALELLARTEGQGRVTLTIASPGEDPYMIGLDVRTTSVKGDATILRPLRSARPVLPYIIVLFRDETGEPPLVNAEVEFRRNGGARMFSDGIEVQSARTTTNDIGWSAPFENVTTDAANFIDGDLIVRFGSPIDSVTFNNVTFAAAAWFTAPKSFIRFGVGPT
jgi:hypothetical protein